MPSPDPVPIATTASGLAGSHAASSSKPRVSVLVVNWNTRGLLSACLDSVRSNLLGFPFEIVVVDNASTDGSVEWLRARCPDVRLIANSENVGFASANNQGLTECTGDYALLLNSDALLHAWTVSRLLDILQTESNAAAVAPMLLNPDGSFQAGPNDDLTLWSEALLTLGLAHFFRGGFYPGYTAQAPRGAYAWVGGTCLLLRRSAWQQIGMLDPEYFMYTEEADWCWRARRAGWTIWYEPSAHATHLGGGSTRHASAKMRAALYKSKLIFFRKHRPRWQTFVLRYLVMSSAAVKATCYSMAAHLNGMHASAWNERATGFRMVIDAVKTPAT